MFKLCSVNSFLNLKPIAMTPKKLLSFYCLLLFSICSLAQGDKGKVPASTTTISAKDIEKLPFSKGINNFTIRQNFGYSRTKPEDSDDYTRGIGLSLDYNRFIVDGFAVGADINLSSFKSEINNIDVIKSSSVMVYGNAIYGNSFSGAINLYGKASVGFGQSKFSSTGNPTDKEDLFGYRFEVGSPIHLYNDGGNYITPFIRYNYIQQKEGSVKFSDNEFSLGFQFQNYSPCSGYQCDCNHGRRFSGNMYEQGSSFIGYTSMGDYGFGKSKFESGSFSDETDISGGSFNLEYGYFVSRDIALGAGFSWNGSSEDDGSGKTTESDFSFMPMITLHAPTKDCFENFFLQGGYGFGSEKIKTGTSEIKYNTTNLCINLGFNHFFGRHIAFTPRIGYEWETFKNTTTNIKDKQSGFEFGFGGTLYW
jgi:hypothetical protein